MAVAPHPLDAELLSLFVFAPLLGPFTDICSVIHPCVHPEDGPAPDTEEKMFDAVVRYMDRVVAATRPRRLLYLAIDGVAPRAKMNQQRARRFKAAKEMADAEEIEVEKRAELAARGVVLPPKKTASFDYNVITPGTGACVRVGVSVRPGSGLRFCD